MVPEVDQRFVVGWHQEKRCGTGTLGKVDNCQIGVFVAYVSEKGRALVDGSLYLPKQLARDRARRRKAGVPGSVRFKTNILHRILTVVIAQPLSLSGDDLWASVLSDTVQSTQGGNWTVEPLFSRRYCPHAAEPPNL